MKNGFLQITTSVWQKIALVFLGLILSLVLLEAGMRLGGFVLLSVQEYGNLRSIKQKGTYRILCLGESTTQGTYPKPLERILNQRHIGVRFSVIDKGRAATNTDFLLSRIESDLAEYHPDMVVAMMGINDNGVGYYRGIPESNTWFFRHCRVYRFGRMIFMRILKKIKRERIDGFSGSELGGKAKPEDARTVSGKTTLSSETSAENITRLDLKDTEGTRGPASPSPDSRRLSGAGKFFEKNAELDRENDKAYIALGRQREAHGKFSQAEDLFKKAVEINPGNDNTYVDLGGLYLTQGKLSQAEDFFKKAVGLNPKSSHAYVGFGGFYLLQDKFLQAEDSYRKAIELNPKADSAYAGLGWLYRQQGKYSEAEDSFRKAVELGPENYKNFVGLGGLYLALNKFSQAEASFKKAIEIDAEHKFDFFELVALYREQGKLSQAENVLRKAIELNPKSSRALGAMASLYEEMGKPELAKEYAKKAQQFGLDVTAAVTVSNYRKLKKILDKKGIKLVCVQYPVRNVGPLMRIFEKEEGVIFVDNEQVFKKALKKERYSEYFFDMFGGDFGHCTQKGDELLARNIADVILREVFNK